MAKEETAEGTGEVVVKHEKIDVYSWQGGRGSIYVYFVDGQFDRADMEAESPNELEKWIERGEISTFIQDKQASFNKEKENTNAR
jgi:hypothetical protein